MAVGDAPASVVHRAAEASRHPVARRLAGAIPAAVVAVAQHPAGRRSAGLVACQVAEEEVAEEEVLFPHLSRLLNLKPHLSQHRNLKHRSNLSWFPVCLLVIAVILEVR